MIRIQSHWPKATEHFILLALAWITFSALFGLFGAFDAMEASRENIAYEALIGAMKTAGLMMIGGFLLAAIPFAAVALARRDGTRSK
jgi:hypothetical protein